MTNTIADEFRSLNAKLFFYGEDGTIQFDADREAARQYFLQHVNQNTVFFHSLREKLDYLVDNDYYEAEFLAQYDFEDVKALYKRAYAYKFRFPTFFGAYKYYTSYTLRTFDGSRYLERYEDRVVAVALYLARGNLSVAQALVDEIITGRFQPATPTFLNAGKKQRGDLVSCFLLRIEDNMESIARGINSSLQLSKRGGGVALLLSNIREEGAPIKKIEGQSSGILPVMKLLEDSFSYANQLGQRNGSGAVYLSAHHPDIMAFLDTRRENADEKVRIKTLSLGVVVPDITFELAKNNEDMYLFSPYDVERVYGVPFADISVTEKYREMVADERITKKKIKAREFLQAIAQVQIESGYPYILFEDTATSHSPIPGRINMSNLCSEILQVNTPTTYNADLSYDKIGYDISCNLGSMNIANAMAGGDLAGTVRTAIRALSAVSDLTKMESVRSVEAGNDASHAIGLGQMNLHGYLASQGIEYGSPESIEFVSAYFSTVLFHALNASCELAQELQPFEGFLDTDYATGKFFEKYVNNSYLPTSDSVWALFDGIVLPTREDWEDLSERVARHGLYNRNLQAVPPTGSISYINHATASIHPVASAIEIRKEGKTGRVYYPAFGLTNENVDLYKNAYDLGYKAIIDVYAAAGEHVDQGLSLTLFFDEGTTTAEINRAQIYAWRKGIRTIYYTRTRAKVHEETREAGCVSCAL
jgi:ribonucleoside-diphosphate reductase alpha chain